MQGTSRPSCRASKRKLGPPTMDALGNDDAHPNDAPPPTRNRWPWLLAHVFRADLDTCCAGPMRWLGAALTPPSTSSCPARTWTGPPLPVHQPFPDSSPDRSAADHAHRHARSHQRVRRRRTLTARLSARHHAGKRVLRILSAGAHPRTPFLAHLPAPPFFAPDSIFGLCAASIGLCADSAAAIAGSTRSWEMKPSASGIAMSARPALRRVPLLQFDGVSSKPCCRRAGCGLVVERAVTGPEPFRHTRLP